MLRRSAFVNDLCLIFLDLTLDNFFNEINRYIHIAGILLSSDNAAFNRNRNLYFLTSFLYAQCNLYFQVSGEKIALQFS